MKENKKGATEARKYVAKTVLRTFTKAYRISYKDKFDEYWKKQRKSKICVRPLNPPVEMISISLSELTDLCASMQSKRTPAECSAFFKKCTHATGVEPARKKGNLVPHLLSAFNVFKKSEKVEKTEKTEKTEKAYCDIALGKEASLLRKEGTLRDLDKNEVEAILRKLGHTYFNVLSDYEFFKNYPTKQDVKDALLTEISFGRKHYGESILDVLVHDREYLDWFSNSESAKVRNAILLVRKYFAKYRGKKLSQKIEEVVGPASNVATPSNSSEAEFLHEVLFGPKY